MPPLLVALSMCFVFFLQVFLIAVFTPRKILENLKDEPGVVLSGLLLLAALAVFWVVTIPLALVCLVGYGFYRLGLKYRDRINSFFKK